MTKLKQIKLTFLLLFLIINDSNAGNSWTARINEKDGLPIVSIGGADVITGKYLFFDKNWSWTSTQFTFSTEPAGDYIVNGRNRDLGFTFLNKITKSKNNEITWNLDLNASSTKNDVIGGGIVFNFDASKFGIDQGTPEILPDKSGWTLGEGNQQISFRVNPKPANIFFERDNKSELRVFFYSGVIREGLTHYDINLKLPESYSIEPTIPEQFGSNDTSEWPKGIMDWRVSPIDLSFLNDSEKPAGKHGFLKAKGEQLIFEDGKIAKFWGTNITSYAIFRTSKDMVKKQAKRLSALGFNLVRIHHFDSDWVDPNIFGSNKSENTQHLSKDAIEKIDWWIKCLKDEGIYVWLDLHTQRSLKSGDGITSFDEISPDNKPVELKGFNYINPSIQDAMRQLNMLYLTHKNIYTDTRYVDEPSIAAVLITNENDITNHYGNNFLPDKNVPFHSKIYMSLANKFALDNNLPEEKVWRSWEQGPSKIFLNDLEHKFDVDMINHLHGIGVKVPIVTTSTWGGNPINSLPSLTTGDMIDAHAYQSFGALSKNPLYAANLNDWFAAAQVVDKPLSVTEWNADIFPTNDRHVLPLLVSSQACFQGWDAMMQFAYSQTPLQTQGDASNWDIYNDPSALATMPAAALMYRRGDVREASTTYVYAPKSETLFDNFVTPDNSVFIRSSAELGKLVIAMPYVKELPWLSKSQIPAEAKISSDPDSAVSLPADPDSQVNNLQIRHNWDKGYMTIDTPKSQAVMGWIGGEKLSLSDIEVVSFTRNATLAVQSLDDMPINQSKDILISLAARSLPKSTNSLPYSSEPVEVNLLIKAPSGLVLYKYLSDGSKKQINASFSNGHYLINLNKSIGSYWLNLSTK